MGSGMLASLMYDPTMAIVRDSEVLWELTRVGARGMTVPLREQIDCGQRLRGGAAEYALWSQVRVGWIARELALPALRALPDLAGVRATWEALRNAGAQLQPPLTA